MLSVTEWNRFMKEATQDFDGKSNVRFPFQVITKRYGRAYIEYLKAAWKAWTPECGTSDYFREINGEVPLAFFNTKILHASE